MDDSSLKSLRLLAKASKEPLALSPPFSRFVREYSCAVQSDLDAIVVQAACNEPDAFAQTQKAAGDGSLAIKEGANEVEIKVDAPDGSSSKYIVHVFRPSGKWWIRLIWGLRPSANDAAVEKATVSPTPLNAKSAISWTAPTQAPANDVVLLPGDTPVEFKVVSADNSATQAVSVVIRKVVTTVASTDATAGASGMTAVAVDATGTPQLRVSCPLCTSDREMESKTGSVLFENSPLVESNQATETKLAAFSAACPFELFGCTAKGVLLGGLAKHVRGCEFAPHECQECLSRCVAPASLAANRHKDPCTFSCSCGSKAALVDKDLHERLCAQRLALPSQTAAQPSSAEWETSLVQRKQFPGPASACVQAAAPIWDEYTRSLAEAWRRTIETRGADRVMPDLDSLGKLASLFATAISYNNEANQSRGAGLDESLHVQLGLVMEEMWLAKETFPQPTASASAKANDNSEASESFMSDEVDGLLLQLGVPPSASDATKIKAIEDEYHRLLGQGLSNQAAEVQGLHAWKIAQVKAAGNAGGLEQDPDRGRSRANIALLHASDKYADAVRINPAGFEANVNFGRSLILLGRYAEAIAPLELALAAKPLSHIPKTLLALARSMSPALSEESDSQVQQIADWLDSDLLAFRMRLWAPVRSDIGGADASPGAAPAALTGRGCLAPDIGRATHVLRCDVFASSARMHALLGHHKQSSDTLLDLLHVLTEAMACVPRHGDTFQRLNHQLCTTQAGLIMSLSRHDSKLSKQIFELTRTTLLPLSQHLVGGSTFGEAAGASAVALDGLALAERVAQTLVAVDPSNAVFLTALGQAQLDQFERNPAFSSEVAKLTDAEASFRAALAASPGGPLSEAIRQQAWWKHLERHLAHIDARAKARAKGPAAGAASKGPAAFNAKKGSTAAPAPAKGSKAGTAPVAFMKAKQPATTSLSAAPASAAGSAPTAGPKPAKTVAPPPKPDDDAAKPAAQPNSVIKKAGAAAPAGAGSKAAPSKPAATLSTTKAQPAKSDPKAGVASKEAAKSGAKPAQTSKPAAAETQAASSPAPASAPTISVAAPVAGTDAPQAAVSKATRLKCHLGLGRVLARMLQIECDDKKAAPPNLADRVEDIASNFKTVIALDPKNHDAYIDLGGLLEKHVSCDAAADVYGSFPFPQGTAPPSQDDLYLHGEVTRTFMKLKRYRDSRLLVSLIAEARALGIRSLSKYTDLLDNAGESKVLMELFSAVNNKSVDDPDMVAFFKSKYWI
ncbi:hypothetical protein HK105_207180 [Polyrhizophydium stewartii]|uniref:Cadherin-like beta-sandwich-like domain-containing protein n=1 Tax=Polyrhizophydium stewartii TaxID=2732419 RepID=A0ABR4N199_9FUNG